MSVRAFIDGPSDGPSTRTSNGGTRTADTETRTSDAGTRTSDRSRRRVPRSAAATATVLGLGLTVGTGTATATRTGELVEAIATESGLSKADARRALDGFVAVTTRSLASGGRVEVEGLGRFDVASVPRARGEGSCPDGRDDGEGKPEAAARNEVRFKAGAELSKSVN